jgi:inosine-uridine nucleoside N-ribohydrolase
MSTINHVWLDVDPVSLPFMKVFSLGSHPCFQGHDDAIAILLAIHCPNVHLLGISTVSSYCDAWFLHPFSQNMLQNNRCMAMQVLTALHEMLPDAYMLSEPRKTSVSTLALLSH